MTIANVLVDSAHRYRKECMLITMAAIEEVTSHMRVIKDLRGKETESTIVPQAKFRPYHSEKVVTGTGTLKARTLETHHLEILEEFDPEALYGTIFDEPLDVEKINQDMVKRILVEEMKNASQGLCDAVFRGVRVADGTGQMDVFDGFDTIINAEKTAGNISLEKGNFMQLGVLSEYNIGDKLRLMWLMVNASLRGGSTKKLKLFLTKKEKEMYNTWYANKFGHGNFAGIPNQTYLHGTQDQVELVALPGMDGAGHVFITTQNNVKVGCDTSTAYNKFSVRIPDNPNLVQMHAQIFLGVDFANIDKEFMFVASRTVKSDEVYMLTDRDVVTFPDTAANASKQEEVKVYGFNLTAASEVTVEGTDAAMFSAFEDTIAADAANAAEGVTITVTFTPTTEGDKTANLRIKNITDDVDLIIKMTGKCTV